MATHESSARPAGRPRHETSYTQDHPPPNDYETTHHHIHINSTGEMESEAMPMLKKARLRPSELEDEYSSMDFDMPMPPGVGVEGDYLEDDAEWGDPAEQLDRGGDDIGDEVEAGTRKRKIYQSSVRSSLRPFSCK